MSWEVIEHKAAPASNIFDFTGLSLGAYQRVVLLLDEVTVSSDGAQLHCQLYTATTLRTTGYRYRSRALTTSATTVSDGQNSSGTAVRIIGSDGTTTHGIGNAASESCSCKLEISNLVSGLYKHIMGDGVAVTPDGSGRRYVVGGILEETGAVDGVRISASTGNITAGKATLYGLTTS